MICRRGWELQLGLGENRFTTPESFCGFPFFRNLRAFIVHS